MNLAVETRSLFLFKRDFAGLQRKNREIDAHAAIFTGEKLRPFLPYNY